MQAIPRRLFSPAQPPNAKCKMQAQMQPRDAGSRRPPRFRVRREPINAHPDIRAMQANISCSSTCPRSKQIRARSAVQPYDPQPPNIPRREWKSRGKGVKARGVQQAAVCQPSGMLAAGRCVFPSAFEKALRTLCWPREAISRLANLASGSRLPALMLSSTLGSRITVRQPAGPAQYPSPSGTQGVDEEKRKWARPGELRAEEEGKWGGKGVRELQR